MNTMANPTNYLGLRRTDLHLRVLFAEGTSGIQGEGKSYRVAPDGRLHAGLGLDSVDTTEVFTTPGLVDLQVNGFAGCDFNWPGMSPWAFETALVEMARTGVTTCLPTIITGRPDHMVYTLESLDRACMDSRLGPLMVPGYHIEGPFLSQQEGFRGAHDARCMTSASLKLIDRLQSVATRPILVVTVAPEVEGVVQLITELCARGITVALGHSAATLEQIEAAIEAGATLSTHLGNGLPQELPKLENPIFWHLAQDRLDAMLIADGIHVPPHALKTMLRAKGVERSILTTDAVSAAGPQMPPGLYPFGALQVERANDGSVRVPGSRYLAGSAGQMDQMLRCVMRWYEVDLRKALRMCQLNAALKLNRRWAAPETGEQAALVEWTMTNGAPKVLRTHIGRYTIE